LSPLFGRGKTTINERFSNVEETSQMQIDA